MSVFTLAISCLTTSNLHWLECILQYIDALSSQILRLKLCRVPSCSLMLISGHSFPFWLYTYTNIEWEKQHKIKHHCFRSHAMECAELLPYTFFFFFNIPNSYLYQFWKIVGTDSQIYSISQIMSLFPENYMGIFIWMDIDIATQVVSWTAYQQWYFTVQHKQISVSML